ncbi:MAG: hypothetical protein HFF52_00710 [Lawsonibacter sp.]|nr:hypothetical protein [Lawsonibacter sp.]
MVKQGEEERTMGEQKQVQAVWNEERRTLTLEGEPVLSYTLCWPRVEGAGLGGRWISRYYDHLAKSWRRRWEREVYWAACLELAGRRESARPFSPWQGSLTGETVLLRDGTLSLRFQGSELRGDGRTARVRWGDVWNIREGAPKPLRSLFSGEKGWKSRLWQALLRQGEARRQAGDCFLDGDWTEKARKARPLRDWCLTEEGVEVSLPQCSAAPAAEGCPTFSLSAPLAGDAREENPPRTGAG